MAALLLTAIGIIIFIQARIAVIRKKAALALQESEERYRKLFEQSPDAAILHNGKKVLYANEAAMELLKAKNFGQLAKHDLARYLRPEDRAEIGAHVQQLLKKKGSVSLHEEVWVCLDDSTITVEVSASAFDYQNERVLQLTARDITAKKKAAQALQNQVKLAQLIQEITLATDETKTLEEAMQMYLDKICDFTDWPVGHVYMPDTQDTTILQPTKIWHLEDQKKFKAFREITEQMTCSRGKGLPGRVLDTKQPVWIVDITKDAHFPRKEYAKAIEVRGGFAFPVLEGKNITAVLEFFSREVEEPDELILAIIANLAIQLGHITERKRAKEAESMKLDLFESLPVGIDIVDQDGIILYANKILQTLAGGNILGKKCYEVYSDCKKQCKNCPLKKPFKIGTHKLTEVGHLLGNRTFQITHTSIVHEGKNAILEIFTDITQRKKIEAAVAESERRYRNLIEYAPDAVLMHNGKNILFANMSAAKLLKAAHPKEIIGMDIMRLIAPNNQKILGERVKRMLEKNQVAPPYEEAYLCIDGSEITVETTATSLIYGGERVLQVVGRDITERKKAEKTLQASENRYRQLVEHSPDAIIIHRKGQVIFINPAGLAMFGAKNEAELLGENIMNYVYPDYHPLVRERIKRMNKGESVPLTEEKFLYANGMPFDVEVAAMPFDYHGDHAIQIIARDITARKDAEAALKESEEQLYDITAGLGEGLYVLDKDCKLTFMNPEAEKILGWREQDLFGKTIHNITHHQKSDGSPYPEDACPVYKATQNGRTYRIEEDVFTCKNGAMLPVSYVVTPLGRQGQISGTVTAFHDISNRKELENKMAHMAHFDELTGLPNRALFFERLDQIYKQSKRYKNIFGLLFIDLDGFKDVNDKYGHGIGDALLKETARRLKKYVRDSDIVARMGGDEFTIILTEIKHADDAARFAKKIITAIKKPYILQGHRCTISSSIGIALYPDNAKTISDLIKKADLAMYTVKEGGKSNFSISKNTRA